MRFVVLVPPGTAAVDVAAGSDPASAKPVASGLQPGTVSDYVAVPTNDQVMVEVGGHRVGTITFPQQGQRQTVAIGMDATGSFALSEFREKDGRVVGVAGDMVGTSGVSGGDANAVPAGKALVIGNGLGNGKIAADSGFTLGQPGKGCLAQPGTTADTSGIRSVVGGTVDFYAEPGTLELAWFADTDCANVASASARASLSAGQEAYGFTWFTDPTHLRLLLVPVTTAGSGKEGVVDSGDGPPLVQTSQGGPPTSSADTTETTG